MIRQIRGIEQKRHPEKHDGEEPKCHVPIFVHRGQVSREDGDGDDDDAVDKVERADFLDVPSVAVFGDNGGGSDDAFEGDALHEDEGHAYEDGSGHVFDAGAVVVAVAFVVL